MNASFGKFRETRKIKILVSLYLSISCPRLGDQSFSKFHYCRKLPVAISCCIVEVVRKRSKFWEADMIWREVLVLVQGEESQRILLKGRIILTRFSPHWGFFPGMCLHLVYIVLCASALGNCLMN